MTEDTEPPSGPSAFPRVSEQTALAMVSRGVRAAAVRLPQVHDTAKQGFVTRAIEMYREKGACAYIGDGLNRWPAAHVLDVARLYRLAIEKAEPNAKYHAVAEEGVPMRDIAEAIGRRLRLPVKSIAPEEAQAFFGWLAMFAGHDMPASSAQTRRKLGWGPTGPGLIADLERLEGDAACAPSRLALAGHAEADLPPSGRPRRANARLDASPDELGVMRPRVPTARLFQERSIYTHSFPIGLMASVIAREEPKAAALAGRAGIEQSRRSFRPCSLCAIFWLRRYAFTAMIVLGSAKNRGFRREKFRAERR